MLKKTKLWLGENQQEGFLTKQVKVLACRHFKKEFIYNPYNVKLWENSNKKLTATCQVLKY